jgi:cephalosporin-C deacetylase-like acetyl esterase
MRKLNRREFVARAGALGLGWNLVPLAAAADRGLSYAQDLQDMLLAHLAQGLNSWFEKWDQERARIRTTADLEARNRFVRQRVRAMIHEYPEKNPLDPRIVKVLERDGYRVENVMFQSRPNFWVTGNLYVPTSGKGPFPGIISPCGHYPLARMQADYQFAYLGLVKSGFVVLAFDPIGQGERRHYWNPETGHTESNLGPVYEHSMPGQLLLLMEEDLTHYRIWDGMRALDYLLTRPEVDSKRIGCAGHSGGGTLTLFISALDERVGCAVVNQGGTSHRWPLKLRPESRVGPADVEQNLFPAAIHGIDLCDLHVAIAPRPLLALIEDYSPQFNLAAEHIRARYQQLGASEKFATEEATDPHAWTVKLRLATTDWCCRWFYGRRGPEREPEFEAEPPENLYCTPNGSLRYCGQGETIFSMIRKKQSELPPKRNLPGGATDFDAFRRGLADEIRAMLRYRTTDQPLAVRPIVTTRRKGYAIEKVEFLSEPGIYIPAWVFVPQDRRGSSPAILFVHEGGKQAEGMEFGALERLARKGELVVAVDVRGIGETRPPHSPSSDRVDEFRHLFDVETAASYMAWAMDRSLFGMRVQDVVRSVDYVLSRRDTGSAGVRVIGKGMGALWVLYAAALDPRIRGVVCENGLVSYRALTQADRYLHGANIFIRDVLKHFDLPQVAAAVSDRPLVLMAPVDAMKRPVEPAVARAAYEWTQQTYARAGAPDRFRIVEASPQVDRTEAYLSI